ncbi:MAG TPA: 50S ribosomal protein L4 [Gemmatimonadaceae bacterium]|nr:50S ribosomal protein L4 [Gemmatimonadaceae bacterium]
MAETAPVFSSYGTKRDPVTLPAELFDGSVNMPVMHQAVKAYLANQRQGNAKTKTRGFVTGGNQKPWKQKGTGRARQGSIRAPNWVGGGKVFGPIPRSYAEYVPRQVRALARKSAFNARANEGGIIVIDSFVYDTPSTKRLVALLTSLGVAEKKVLILTDGVKQNVFLSGRNLPAAHVMPYSDVSTYHLLWSDVVLIESSAIGFSLEPLGEKAPELPSRVRPVAAESTKSTKKRSAKAESGAPKAPTKKKTAAKKAVAKKKAAPKAEAKAHKPAAKKAIAKKSAKKSSGKKKGK